MRHVAAYLLAAMGAGQPTAASIKSILGSVGVEADDKQLAVLIDKLSGKNVVQLIQEGMYLTKIYFHFISIKIPICHIYYLVSFAQNRRLIMKAFTV